MFDIGISEIAVIAVVALVVIGPERLPKVARTVGTLLGRAQRYVNDVKAEVNREMELDELRKLQTEMQDAARGVQEQVSTAGAEMQSAVHDMEKQLHDDAAPAAAANSPAEPARPDSGAPGSMTPLSEPPPEATPAATESTPSADKPAQSSLFPERTIR
jgi:sec-independent protein translocase protein TatB